MTASPAIERNADPAVSPGAMLNVDALEVRFRLGKKHVVHAVSGISFQLEKGETLGLVGESGCGKSTTARAIMQLPPPTSGRITLGKDELTAASGEKLRQLRRRFQMIFQDPIASLNPRRRVRDILEAPLIIAGETDPDARLRKVESILDAVGLDPDVAMEKRPHEFSGGQCQRISIARAIILEPDLLICDEPVSALDVSIQAQILNLLREMKQRFTLTMLFISHDLAVVRNVSDRVAVMYLGKICEIASAVELYQRPRHPYTRALLSAIPIPDPRVGVRKLELGDGEIPSPLAPPTGCRFHTRCPHAQAKCAAEEPVLSGGGHGIACHFPLD